MREWMHELEGGYGRRKTYDERLAETHARSLAENVQLYNQRRAEGKETGVLERVISEQASGSQNTRSE